MPNFKADYKFDNFKINVDNKTSNMRYFNQGEFIINDTIHMTLRCITWSSLSKSLKVYKTL
jgi:hypothetical protein